MTAPVRLLFFTQTLGCETCLQTKQILDELPPLSEKITVDEANLVLDADKAKQYGIDRVPSIALVGTTATGEERDSRIRFDSPNSRSIPARMRSSTVALRIVFPSVPR